MKLKSLALLCVLALGVCQAEDIDSDESYSPPVRYFQFDEGDDGRELSSIVANLKQHKQDVDFDDDEDMVRTSKFVEDNLQVPADDDIVEAPSDEEFVDDEDVASYVDGFEDEEDDEEGDTGSEDEESDDEDEDDGSDSDEDGEDEFDEDDSEGVQQQHFIDNGETDEMAENAEAAVNVGKKEEFMGIGEEAGQALVGDDKEEEDGHVDIQVRNRVSLLVVILMICGGVVSVGVCCCCRRVTKRTSLNFHLRSTRVTTRTNGNGKNSLNDTEKFPLLGNLFGASAPDQSVYAQQACACPGGPPQQAYPGIGVSVAAGVGGAYPGLPQQAYPCGPPAYDSVFPAAQVGAAAAGAGGIGVGAAAAAGAGGIGTYQMGVPTYLDLQAQNQSQPPGGGQLPPEFMSMMFPNATNMV